MNLDTTHLDAWVEWKELCALARCRASTQTVLRHYVSQRFRSLVQRYHFQTNVPSPVAFTLLPTDPWHLLETHFTLPHASGGKRYKDWLFDWAAQHQPGGLAGIENGVALLLRDVVRDYLRQEFSPARMISLDRLAPGAEHDLRIEDLLVGQLDPAAETERREFERHAAARAQAVWSGLTQRERVALLAKALGLSLAESLVQELAGCGKSMVNQAYRDLAQRLATRLEIDYPDDDRPALVLLAVLTVRTLQELARDWGKSENGCRPLFDMAEAP